MFFDGSATGASLSGEVLPNRQSPRHPILVAGMHRSGTSWLGRMLCASRELVYVPEPLSPLNRQTILKSRVSRWFTYINDDNESAFLTYYQDAASFKPHPVNDIRRARLGSPRDPIRIPKRWASFLIGRLQSRRVLFRDPFAIFSIEWFARRLPCQVVVIVRHPLAVVSSLKRLGYTFDFKNLLDQEALMAEQLEGFRPEMEALVGSSDVIAQGNLLWRIIYGHVASIQERNSSIRVVRHEDLSLRPVEEYGLLYDALGLSFSKSARLMIERHVSERNPQEVSTRNPFDVRLDSRQNLGNWRRRLSDGEIDEILVGTRTIADRFYPERGEELWT
jgi:hypothetical protein